MSVFKTIYSVSNFIRECHAGLSRGILIFVDNTLVYLDKSESLRDHKLMDIWRGDKIKEWRKLVKNKQNTCACEIAEGIPCLNL